MGDDMAGRGRLEQLARNTALEPGKVVSLPGNEPDAVHAPLHFEPRRKQAVELALGDEGADRVPQRVLCAQFLHRQNPSATTRDEFAAVRREVIVELIEEQDRKAAELVMEALQAGKQLLRLQRLADAEFLTRLVVENLVELARQLLPGAGLPIGPPVVHVDCHQTWVLP